MANVDYEGVVPRPEIGWKPEGFLAGQLYARDRNRFDDRASLADAMAGMGAQKARGELEDYFANAPVREATRLGTIATEMGKAETAQPRARADLQGVLESNTKAARENKLGNATFQSDLATKLAANVTARGESGRKQFQSMAEAAILVSGMDTSTLEGRTDVLSRLSQFGMEKDPRILAIVNDPNPQSRMTKAKHLMAILNMADEKMRAEEAKGLLHNKGTLDVARQQGSNMVAAANARGNVTKTWEDSLAGAKTVPHQIAVAKMILLSPDVDDVLKNQAKSVLVGAIQQMAITLKVRIPPTLPGMPPNELVKVIDALSNQLATQGQPFGDPRDSPGSRPGEMEIDFNKLK